MNQLYILFFKKANFATCWFIAMNYLISLLNLTRMNFIIRIW